MSRVACVLHGFVTAACSWHVLSRDNIARVKKDEAEARALEAKKVEKTARAVSVHHLVAVGVAVGVSQDEHCAFV